MDSTTAGTHTPESGVTAAPLTSAGPENSRLGTVPAVHTHEAFVQAVAALGIARVAAVAPDDGARLLGTKVVYGVGAGTGARGVCYGGAWANGSHGHDLVEVCAFGQESPIQLMGTTLHELGHVLAGTEHGHDKPWRAACARLGLTVAHLYQAYAAEHFAPDLWPLLAALPIPNDGKPEPHARRGAGRGTALPRLYKQGGGCRMGAGTKGGRSTGPGSGRMHLWTCACDPPQRVRKAGELHATCTAPGGCAAPFTRAEKVPPPGEAPAAALGGDA